MNARSHRTQPQVAGGEGRAGGAAGAGEIAARSPRRRHGWLCAALLLAAIFVGAPAQAENFFARLGGQTLDLVLVRPAGVGKIVTGFVLFLPAALFAEVPVKGWFNDDGYSAVGDAWGLFVLDSFNDTFKTPLGDFEGAI
jgi:hypothetical protein